MYADAIVNCTTVFRWKFNYVDSYGQGKKIYEGELPINNLQHAELDLFYPGNLLIAGRYIIYTLDPQTLKETFIVGQTAKKLMILNNNYDRFAQGSDVWFHNIRSILQVSKNIVLIADTSFSCIRLLNRTDDGVVTVAGACNDSVTEGINGGIGTSRLAKPVNLVKEPSGSVIISDQISYKLLRLSTTNWVLSTLKKLDSTSTPASMTFDVSKKYLYMNVAHGGLIRFDPNTNQLVRLKNSEVFMFGFKDGPLASAKFDDWYDMVAFSDTLFLAADGAKLRLIDLKRSRVSSICALQESDYSPDFIYGPINECSILLPRTLVKRESTVVIGTARYFRLLSYTGKLLCLFFIRI